MQELHYYNTLLNNLQKNAPEKAEYLDEEINILIHKLKFISSEQRPTVLVLDQKHDFEPLYNEQLADTIAIAGGVLLQEKFDNPSLILIIQHSESLYSQISALLSDHIISQTEALQHNNLYIIQKEGFGTTDNFLEDVEISAEIIQPKYFIYGRQGTDWLKFDIA
ncbi:hypothetical protein [Sphingobacterium wenxiniae]|uniref:Iron complex transport system substrate-binding protein n=1 Tax=Sphingobacterium wenxiniae TaxID=683125 RepID=A0A1I6V2N9_9SPHI|nr:hypothetical protein [Sphingobacterium wenxiniae]SFT07934.1 iron complex transport system substrate-binding protein [Sphingobacterium wenxiniae]